MRALFHFKSEQRCVRCGVVLSRKCGIKLGLTIRPKHFGTDVFCVQSVSVWMQMLVLVVYVYVSFPRCGESVIFTNNDIIYTKLVGCEFELGVAEYTALPKWKGTKKMLRNVVAHIFGRSGASHPFFSMWLGRINWVIYIYTSSWIYLKTLWRNITIWLTTAIITICRSLNSLHHQPKRAPNEGKKKNKKDRIGCPNKGHLKAKTTL